MRKFLVWPDGSKRELVPITFEEFGVLGLWDGSNDTAWTRWKYQNGYSEYDDFNEEALFESILILETGEPKLEFEQSNRLYDQKEYFDKNTEHYHENLKEVSVERQKHPLKTQWPGVSELQVEDLMYMTIPEYNEKWNLKGWNK